MEAVLQAAHPFGGFSAQRSYGDNVSETFINAYELKIVRVHIAEELLRSDRSNHVDSDKWKPLIMSFSKFYGLADRQVTPSKFAEISEDLYQPAEQRSNTRQPNRDR